jgi:diguanylate cyclase (GGDEF)-like protein
MRASEERLYGAPQRWPLSSRYDDAWRLLVRIAWVRWVAIALATSYVLVGRTARTSATWLVAGILMATALNTAVALHSRLPRLHPGATALATAVGDYVWITVAAAVIAVTHNDLTAVLGYVVLASECGLLMGWPGALGALAAAIAGLVGLETLQAQRLVGEATAGIAFEAGAVAVSAVFAAVASAELRAQHDKLTAQSVSLARHARTDHLTGLGNAVALREAAAAMARRPYGLLLVDVDRLHSANIVYGHEAGDEMLVAVARVLAGICTSDDLAVRLAEDKFVLLLPAVAGARTRELAEEVRVAVHGVPVSAGELRVSVGSAWTAGDDDLDAVMARADDALQVAKVCGGDRVAAQGEACGEGRWRWRSAVESVLGSDRGVYAVYHSIVRLRDGAVTGWEALSRPRDWPASASVEGMFLTAHRLGRGRELDWRCRRNALWEASRVSGDLFVNVNVAALADPVHDVDQMLLLCTWARRDPRTVVLELSERDVVPELHRVRRVLADYRAAGFRFAVDDVGQGQTTLELLLAARPEFLKLAQPLVQAARAESTARSAVRALVAFAHDIGSVVVAEGVEDEADLALCMEMRIDLGQGWLFGRPLPAERLPM